MIGDAVLIGRWSGSVGLCRNSSANSKCTAFTFSDDQKQNTKQ